MNYNEPDFERQLNNFLQSLKREFGDLGKWLSSIILAILIIVGGYTSYYIVQPDEEAVIIRLGRYINNNPPGLHFKLPFGIDRHIIVKTTKVHQLEFGFRTSEVPSRGHTRYSRGDYGSESLMLTGDLNVADVEWVVQYKISNPYKYLFKANNPIQTIRDVSESVMRRVVGDKSVNDVLTTGRAEIADEAKVLSQKILTKYGIGIKIAAVKLQDVNPPESVKPSFNEVNEAKQEQEKWINQAEEKYNKVIPEAKGKAQELISKAEGSAEAIVNRAEGDTAKFKSVLAEYKRAPSITRKRLYLETMVHIFKKFEKLTIVDNDIKGLLPVFNETKADK